ncbi:MAG: ABC-type transport system involved in resistance to organic solvent, ATPase component [Acidobacteria bacterium]|nr:ABC-type transport system involved in resistance to organic solvent, ATPase component [Acidobacteriota bacterium]
MSDTQPNDAPAIEFRNVFLNFDDQPALVDISFQLARGEMIFITGAAGSGKSVLLHLALGLLKPDAGQIFVAGREIETLDEPELLALRGGLMGMVFQEDSLFSGITVYENAAYRLEERGWSEERIEQAVREVLRFVGLEGDEEKLPEELSGGMKRRLEIARALIGWPSIMLFDEPTMGLDPIVAVQVLDLIIRARDINGVSSLFVTKKLYELPYLTGYRASGGSANDEIAIAEAPANQLPRTRIMVLDQGRFAFTGSVAEFQNSDLPLIKDLLTLDHHDHSADPYYPDPWDKRRRPSEEIL